MIFVLVAIVMMSNFSAFLGRGSSVLCGLDVPESFSHVQQKSIGVSAKRLKPDIERPNTVVETTSNTAEQHVATEIDYFTIPFSEPTSFKVELKNELLKLQIESVKREIYLRELSIYQNEKNLDEHEKNYVYEKCNTIFTKM